MSWQEIIGRCEVRFRIRVTGPVPGAGASRVFFATRVRQDVVLKVGLDETAVIREVNALEELSGRGAIRVVDCDPSIPAVLLERAAPGQPLASVTDDGRATEIFCSVLDRLDPRPATGTHESIEQHVSAITRYQETRGPSGPLPFPWVARALEFLRGLVASTDRPVLLHGDLHHGNIVRHGNGWAVIDPKGLRGDRHFEVIQYLLNYPRRGGDVDLVLRRRMAMLTERLALDAERMARWGVVKGVLDACWALEDGTDWHSGLEAAERFARCLVASESQAAREWMKEGTSAVSGRSWRRNDATFHGGC